MITEKTKSENILVNKTVTGSLVRYKKSRNYDSRIEMMVGIEEELKHRTNIELKHIVDLCNQIEYYSTRSSEQTHELILDLEQMDDSENIMVSLVDLFGTGYVSVMIIGQLNILVPVSQYDEFERVEVENKGDWVTYPLSILSESLN